jgi:hypothetical protein
MTDGRLKKFFEDLAEDSALYNSYLRDPVATMREYGLDEETITAVMTGDLRGLNSLLKGEAIICGTIVQG